MGVIQKIQETLHLGKHATNTSQQTSRTTVFDPSKVVVIFVLGGPGVGEPFCLLPESSSLMLSSGKGTQCANLVRDFAFKHLSGE